MMLRVAAGLLDFNEDIDVESQVKLFEDLDSTYGDFSYQFSLKWTPRNIDYLGLPVPDNASKIIYQNVDCDLLDDEGLLLYRGLLRVEAMIFNRSIQCSFFSGNYNWMAQIDGSVSDLYLEDLNADITEANIINFTLNTSGVIFPFIDTGGLITRSTNYLKIEDFTPTIYLHTLFNKIFSDAGLKIKGDFIKDYVFNRAVIAKGLSNKTQIDDRSTYVAKTSDQIVFSGAADAKITFDDDSTYPYFDGAANNYSLVNDRYTADKKMDLKIDASLVLAMNNSPDRQYIKIYKNGVSVRTYSVAPIGAPADQTFTFSTVYTLNTGDYIELWVSAVAFAGLNTLVREDSTVRFTPTFLYSFKGNEIVPTWSKKMFVSNVLNLFNVITDYDPFSKELTMDLFKNIKSKTPIDISKYININEVNFEEFIGKYGRNNIFTYSESDTEELREYNVKEYVRYGQGVIEVNNSFIPETADVVVSDFKAPTSYISGVFSTSLERVNFIQLEEGESTDFTSVTDSSGIARFNGIQNIFGANDLVRISESTDERYNGDFVIGASVGGGFITAKGVYFNTNATGKITKLNYKYTNTDDVYIFIGIPSIDVQDFTDLTDLYLVENSYLVYSYAYFNLLDVGLPVNSNYNQGLSFGNINNILSYQRTLLDTYWPNLSPILNDPVKIKAVSYMPKSVYLSLTPLRPVAIKTKETTNLYYVNRKTGYKSQSKPFEIELIKLS